MKFTFIFKESLQRPRFVDIDADSFEAISAKDVPEEFLGDMFSLYGVVDYAGARTVPVVISNGKFVQVPDGDFGELTPAEYFEERSG
jgi:hypothetical protein